MPIEIQQDFKLGLIDVKKLKIFRMPPENAKHLFLQAAKLAGLWIANFMLGVLRLRYLELQVNHFCTSALMHLQINP